MVSRSGTSQIEGRNLGFLASQMRVPRLVATGRKGRFEQALSPGGRQSIRVRRMPYRAWENNRREPVFRPPVGLQLLGIVVIILMVPAGAKAQQVPAAAPVPSNAPAVPSAGEVAAAPTPFLTAPAESDSPLLQAGRSGAGDKSIPAKVLRHAGRTIQRYDANGDGRLDKAEWSRIPGDPRAADLNHDGMITLDELAQYMADYGRRRRIRLISPLVDEAKEYPALLNPTTAAETPQKHEQNAVPQGAGTTANAVADAAGATSPPASVDGKKPTKFYVPGSRLAGLPDWFKARDADGDGQLTQAEFAPGGSKSDVDQFSRFDRNGDGVVTAEECARGPAMK